MSRENLRPIFRWMPLWLLRACFCVVVVIILLPAAIWDAIRGIFLTIRHDWREMHDEFSGVAVRPHIGQIMAECDCDRVECFTSERCLHSGGDE